MVLMAVAKGASMITETIFENRFMHVPELCRMGADINVHGASAIVRGLEGCPGPRLWRPISGLGVAGPWPARGARRNGGQSRLPPGPRLRAAGREVDRLRRRDRKTQGLILSGPAATPYFGRQAAMRDSAAAISAAVMVRAISFSCRPTGIALGRGKAQPKIGLCPVEGEANPRPYMSPRLSWPTEFPRSAERRYQVAAIAGSRRTPSPWSYSPAMAFIASASPFAAAPPHASSAPR